VVVNTKGDRGDNPGLGVRGSWATLPHALHQIHFRQTILAAFHALKPDAVPGFRWCLPFRVLRILRVMIRVL
jgi:hypothetical protein